MCPLFEVSFIGGSTVCEMAMVDYISLATSVAKHTTRTLNLIFVARVHYVCLSLSIIKVL